MTSVELQTKIHLFKYEMLKHTRPSYDILC